MLNLAQVENMLTRLPIRDRFSRRLVPFKLNPNQKITHQKLLKLQQQRKLMRAIVLKARRVGISSYAEGLGLCQGLSRDGAKAQIVAHQYKSSKGLFEVPLNLVRKGLKGHASLVDMLAMPKPTQHIITIPHSSGDSTVEIGTAGSVEGSRGLGFSFLHLSEAAFYESLGSFAALLPTVPRDLSTIIIIESTANGRAGIGEHFYDFWENAVAGQNEYVPIFIPWMDDPNCIADPEIASDAPIDEEERMLMSEFHCTKSQLAWRRLTIETECKGYLPLFHQEYPHTAEAAFVATGDPVFEPDELAYARSTCQEPKLIGTLSRHDDRTNFYFEEGDVESINGEPVHIHVWELPIVGDWYYLGADAARGIREMGENVNPDELGDFASIVVWNGNTGNQAARLAMRINPERLADFCDRLGRWYNKAMVSIELTGNLGLWAQAVLRDRYHYPNLYRWRNRDDRIRAVKPSPAIGWETTMRTRPMMMDAFRHALRERRVIVRDKATYNQMDSCERSDDFRWQVKRGHDDILISALVGWICLEQWAPPRRGLGAKSPLADEVDESQFKFRNDLQSALDAHSKRMQLDIARGGKLTAFDGTARITNGLKTDGKRDRLQGI